MSTFTSMSTSMLLIIVLVIIGIALFLKRNMKKPTKKDSGNFQAINQTIKVRCVSCNELNNEDAIFCSNCGAKLRQ